GLCGSSHPRARSRCRHRASRAWPDSHARRPSENVANTRTRRTARTASGSAHTRGAARGGFPRRRDRRHRCGPVRRDCMSSPPALALSVLRRIAPIGEAALLALERIASPRDFAAREWLLEGGQPAIWSFLVTEGLVREIYIGESGAEWTRVFVKEGQL